MQGTPVISQPSSSRSAIDTTKAELHAAIFRLVGGTLLILVIGIATLLWLRHARHSIKDNPGVESRFRRFGRSSRKPTRKSAWEESGKRLDERGRPPFEPGADDETVDLDPTDLGPEDIGPKNKN